ncbi:MAG: hypothetical protein LBC97_01235 [Bifidobacteriaceae bacterium]|jgi:hypothetical protein|nr:hypothetical protein [Bifidobacteriaceae bacterium]
MAKRWAGRFAAGLVLLGLAWAWAGCGAVGPGDGASESAGQGSPDPVLGEALKFEEQTPLDPNGWDVTGPADRWVLVAADDAELSELLAQTAVPNRPGAEPEPQEVPPIPEDQTALLYFVGYRSHTAVQDSTVGVYESGDDWVVHVRRTDSDHGEDTVSFERHLVFVDAGVPDTVRLRFEDTTRDPTEVTWW